MDLRIKKGQQKKKKNNRKVQDKKNKIKKRLRACRLLNDINMNFKQ